MCPANILRFDTATHTVTHSYELIGYCATTHFIGRRAITIYVYEHELYTNAVTREVRPLPLPLPPGKTELICIARVSV